MRVRLAAAAALLLLALPARAGDLPNPKLTPGLAVVALTQAKLCAKSFRTGAIRAVSAATKRAVLKAYGIKDCRLSSSRQVTSVPSFADGVVLPIAQLLALDTQARAVFTDSRICWREFVPSRTMSTTGLDGARTGASQDIFPMAHRLQMCRIYASRVSANMVELGSQRYAAAGEVVRENMRAVDLALKEHASIAAAFEDRTAPVPASSGLIDSEARPERLVKSLKSGTHDRDDKALPPCGQLYEIDHLISLEIGGSNDPKNLWPQSYTTRPLNAHVKDKLENRLHQLVCAKKLDLKTAQQAIARNWIAAYRKYLGKR